MTNFVHPRRQFCGQTRETQTDASDVTALTELINAITEDQVPQWDYDFGSLEPVKDALRNLWLKRSRSNSPSKADDALLDIERLRNIRKQCRNLFIPSDQIPKLSPTPMAKRYSGPCLETPRSEAVSTPAFSPRIPDSPWIERLERAQPNYERSVGAPEFTVSSRSPIIADESLTIRALERAKIANKRSQSPVGSQHLVSWLRKVSLESTKENRPVYKR